MRFILAFLVAQLGVNTTCFSSPKVWFQNPPACLQVRVLVEERVQGRVRQAGVNRVPQDRALPSQFGLRVFSLK